MLVSGGVSKHEVESCQGIPRDDGADDEGYEVYAVADRLFQALGSVGHGQRIRQKRTRRKIFLLYFKERFSKKKLDNCPTHQSNRSVTE